MIQSLQIVDANYAHLSKKFPVGLKLALDNNINLIVGPNNVGKTALIRMIATSLEFDKYFKTNGISCMWDYSIDGTTKSVRTIVEDLKNPKEIEPGWYFWDHWVMDNAFTKICQRHNIPYTNNKRTIKNDTPNDSKYSGYACTFYVISQELRQKILGLENELKQDTDANRWGFIKPAISPGEEVFFQTFDLPMDKNSVIDAAVGLRRYALFANTDNFYRGEPQKSPGYELYERIEEFFDKTVATFFAKHERLTWTRKDYSIQRQLKAWELGHKPTESVPIDARLCVVMDEPTIFLDAANKFRFHQKMQQMTRQYAGRLQFFVATNDYALIKGLEGSCTYINMYETPVISSSCIDLLKYIPTESHK